MYGCIWPRETEGVQEQCLARVGQDTRFECRGGTKTKYRTERRFSKSIGCTVALDARRWKGFNGTNGNVLPCLWNPRRRHLGPEKSSPLAVSFRSVPSHLCWVHSVPAAMSYVINGSNAKFSKAPRSAAKQSVA